MMVKDPINAAKIRYINSIKIHAACFVNMSLRFLLTFTFELIFPFVVMVMVMMTIIYTVALLRVE